MTCKSRLEHNASGRKRRENGYEHNDILLAGVRRHADRARLYAVCDAMTNQLILGTGNGPYLLGRSDSARGVERRSDDADYLRGYAAYSPNDEWIFSEKLPPQQLSLWGDMEKRKTIWD